LLVEQRESAGDVILSITRGAKTLKAISDDLNKTHPTVLEVLQELKRGNWVIRTGNNYEINRQRLIDFYAKGNLNRKEREKLTLCFNSCLELLAYTRQKTTIQMIGAYSNFWRYSLNFTLGKKVGQFGQSFAQSGCSPPAFANA